MTETAQYPVQAVANEFLTRGAEDMNPLTPMKLLKLVYIAHGWHLAVTGRPLFDNPVEAWKYGPVVPSLFHEFKSFGRDPISRLASATDQWERGDGQSDPDFHVDKPFIPDDDADTLKLIDWVWKAYGHMDGVELSDLTHKPGTPWSTAVERMRSENPGQEWVPGYEISNDHIRDYYVGLWKSRAARL